MRELWWMARASWQQTALLASVMAMPAEGEEPFVASDFNPFLAGVERDRMSTAEPYDPRYLQKLQDGT